MAVAVKLPEISMGVTEATIVRWLKAVGDRIEAGEPLVEVETAKSTVEVEAPAVKDTGTPPLKFYLRQRDI